MAITNLTNTMWVFKDDLVMAIDEAEFNINFLTNGEAFTSLTIEAYRGYVPVNYNEIPVFNGSWANSNYKTISITNGEDVENPKLIAFLEENAVQIIDLKNTTWILDNNIHASVYSQTTFYINFVSNGKTFSSMYGYYPGSPLLQYDDTQVYGDNGWVTQDYRTITITGGTDVANANLYLWLTTYGVRKLEYNENKIGLKIYKDLTLKEISSITSEEAFYFSDGVIKWKDNVCGTLNTKYNLCAEITLETDATQMISTDWLNEVQGLGLSEQNPKYSSILFNKAYIHYTFTGTKFTAICYELAQDTFILVNYKTSNSSKPNAMIIWKYLYGNNWHWATTAEFIDNKQNKLTAGEGITIKNNVISATGGSGGGMTGAIPRVTELPTEVTSDSPSLVYYNGVIYALIEEEE